MEQTLPKTQQFNLDQRLKIAHATHWQNPKPFEISLTSSLNYQKQKAYKIKAFLTDLQ